MHTAGERPRRSAVQAIAQFLVLAFFLANCGSSSKEPTELQFSVVDSLLGGQFVIPAQSIAVCPPRHWGPVAEAVQQEFAGRLSQFTLGQFPSQPLKLFLDTLNSSGLLVSIKPGLRLGPDTTVYLARLRQSLADRYGVRNCTSAEFTHNGMLVKQLMISDSLAVQFRLISFRPGRDALELLYFVPRNRYEGMVRDIESSIGSLKPIN